MLIKLGFADEAFFHKVEGQLQLIGHLLHFGVAFYPEFDTLDFLHLCLGAFLVVPEVGHVGAQLFLFKLYALGVDVEVAAQGFGALGSGFELVLCYH